MFAFRLLVSLFCFAKAAFDEEENEVRGTLVFRPPVEILPKTKRTEEMQKRKIAAWPRGVFQDVTGM